MLAAADGEDRLPKADMHAKHATHIKSRRWSQRSMSMEVDGAQAAVAAATQNGGFDLEVCFLSSNGKGSLGSYGLMISAYK